jgi:hypothetical protein
MNGLTSRQSASSWNRLWKVNFVEENYDARAFFAELARAGQDDENMDRLRTIGLWAEAQR